MSKNLRRWLRYMALLVIILILCLQSQASSEKLTGAVSSGVSAVLNFFGGKSSASSVYYAVRKCGHFLVFALLSLFGHLAISGDASNNKAGFYCSTITGVIIALVAEFCQASALGRHATFKDALINLGGTALGIIIGSLVTTIQRHRRAT